MKVSSAEKLPGCAGRYLSKESHQQARIDPSGVTMRAFSCDSGGFDVQCQESLRSAQPKFPGTIQARSSFRRKTALLKILKPLNEYQHGGRSPAQLFRFRSKIGSRS